MIDFFQSFGFRIQELFSVMKTEIEQICQQNLHRIQTLKTEVNSLNNKNEKLEEKSHELKPSVDVTP